MIYKNTLRCLHITLKLLNISSDLGLVCMFMGGSPPLKQFLDTCLGCTNYCVVLCCVVLCCVVVDCVVMYCVVLCSGELCCVVLCCVVVDCVV